MTVCPVECHARTWSAPGATFLPSSVEQAARSGDDLGLSIADRLARTLPLCARLFRQMKPVAFRIIALEPEPERGRRLQELIRERVDAEVIVARSWDDAAAAMASHLPDVILISS